MASTEQRIERIRDFASSTTHALRCRDCSTREQTRVVPVRHDWRPRKGKLPKKILSWPGLDSVRPVLEAFQFLLLFQPRKGTYSRSTSAFELHPIEEWERRSRGDREGYRFLSRIDPSFNADHVTVVGKPGMSADGLAWATGGEYAGQLLVLKHDTGDGRWIVPWPSLLEFLEALIDDPVDMIRQLGSCWRYHDADGGQWYPEAFIETHTTAD